MKKVFILLLTCLPVLAFAQPGPIKIDLGIKAGMNFTRMTGDTWTGGYRSGITAGAFGAVGVKKIGGQIELLYSTTTLTAKGSEFNKAALLRMPGDSTSQGSFSMGYLQVPILLNLKLFGNAVIQLGPQFTTLLSANDRDDFSAAPASSLFNESDLGGVVGVTLKLPLNLQAGIRYSFGFSDQKAAAITNLNDSWKMQSIQVHAGFSFL